MKGLRVEPGDRLAVVALTWPSMPASEKSAQPTQPRTRMVCVSTSIAAALCTPWLARTATNWRIARSITACVGAWIESSVSVVSDFASASKYFEVGGTDFIRSGLCAPAEY